MMLRWPPSGLRMTGAMDEDPCSSRRRRASRSKTVATGLMAQLRRQGSRILNPATCVKRLQAGCGKALRGDIADLLGHKSITITRRYAHLGPNKLHAVVSLLGASDITSDTDNSGVPATSL
jgi:integrase